jgi:predicted RNA-binding protein with PUA domain
MCKEGTAAWGKQNRDAKTANAKLLSEVAAGNVKPEGIEAAQETIEKARKVVAARADKVGYNNITAAAKAMGVEAPAVS